MPCQSCNEAEPTILSQTCFCTHHLPVEEAHISNQWKRHTSLTSGRGLEDRQHEVDALHSLVQKHVVCCQLKGTHEASNNPDVGLKQADAPAGIALQAGADPFPCPVLHSSRLSQLLEERYYHILVRLCLLDFQLALLGTQCMMLIASAYACKTLCLDL
jgi:hypothetical protein